MNSIVCGLQWGDEGKGKIVDYNAGHTVIAKGEKYVLHMLPSGILWENKTNLIGNGVVMDPVNLCQEISDIEARGIAITPDNLLISDRAHIVLPYHRELDAAREAALGNNKIGTTKRGIGPTYADKANRCGLRLADLLDEKTTRQLLDIRLEDANATLAKYDLPTFTTDQILDHIRPAIERLRPHVTNTIPHCHEAYKSGKTILFEGAQGSYLDIDFGTYPFVTSSNTTSGGAITGSGLPPHAIDEVIGVCKAYTTRVGSGPFITENQEFSDHMHSLGLEFGATTGRPRRCGWLDATLIRFACMVNGVTKLAVTILDGLDSRDTIQICSAYNIDGELHTLPPADRSAWDRATPVYDELPGWKCDTSKCRSWDDLPQNAQRYLQHLSDLTDTKVGYIGVGPDRDQTIIL